MNFIAFHSAYPYEAELAEQAKNAKVKNIYAEMGLLAGVLRSNPQRFAQCLGTLLDGLGAVGPADRCRAQIAAFARTGVTPVVLPFASPGPDARASMLRTFRTFP